ncbi:MAG: hypothetical protein HYU37_14840 [Acidobacteria bacterium]|nr:hypothetical protein [Acidobacteriota bacterium]
MAEERQRIQVEFTPEAFARLKEVKELSGKKSYAEVVREAILVYEWLLKQKRQDAKFQVVKGDSRMEVELVPLL